MDVSMVDWIVGRFGLDGVSWWWKFLLHKDIKNRRIERPKIPNWIFNIEPHTYIFFCQRNFSYPHSFLDFHFHVLYHILSTAITVSLVGNQSVEFFVKSTLFQHTRSRCGMGVNVKIRNQHEFHHDGYLMLNVCECMMPFLRVFLFFSVFLVGIRAVLFIKGA